MSSSAADIQKQVQDVLNAMQDFEKECEKLGVKDHERMQKLRLKSLDEDEDEE